MIQSDRVGSQRSSEPRVGSGLTSGLSLTDKLLHCGVDAQMPKTNKYAAPLVP